MPAPPGRGIAVSVRYTRLRCHPPHIFRAMHVSSPPRLRLPAPPVLSEARERTERIGTKNAPAPNPHRDPEANPPPPTPPSRAQAQPIRLLAERCRRAIADPRSRGRSGGSRSVAPQVPGPRSRLSQSARPPPRGPSAAETSARQRPARERKREREREREREGGREGGREREREREREGEEQCTGHRHALAAHPSHRFTSESSLYIRNIASPVPSPSHHRRMQAVC